MARLVASRIRSPSPKAKGGSHKGGLLLWSAPLQASFRVCAAPYFALREWLQLCRNHSLQTALAQDQQQPEGKRMIIGFLPFALLGAMSGSALMSSYGVWEAVIAAPIGGSLGAALAGAGVWLMSLPSPRYAYPRAKRTVAAHFVPMWTASAHA